MNEVIAEIFIDRLQERYRRRQIVKDYGLVEYNRHQLWIKSLEVYMFVIHYFYEYTITYIVIPNLILDCTRTRNDATIDSLYTFTETCGF